MNKSGSIDHLPPHWQGLEALPQPRPASLKSLSLPRASSLLFVAAIAGTVSLFVLQVALLFRYTVDDAFISYRYAQNLANGFGLVFNQGERVEGYTNFLWVLMLAGASKLSADPEMASKALGLAFAFGTLPVTWLLGSALRRPPHPIVSLVAPALLAVNPAIASWTVGGLEAMSLAFFVTLGVYLYLIEQRDGAPLSALPLLAAALSRPEGVWLWAITLIHRLARRRRLSPQDRSSIQKELAFVGLFLVPYVTYLIWRFSYYDSVLPNTFYARGGASLEQLRGGLSYGLRFATEPANLVFWIVVPFVWLAWRKEGLTSKHSYLSAAVLLYMLYIVLSDGDWMPAWRFFVPILPLMAVMVQDVVAQAWQFVAARATARYPRRAAVGVGAFAVALILLLSGATFARSHDDLLSDYNQASRTVAQFLREQGGPDASLAVTDAGVLPYESGLRTLDLTGLVDSHIGHLPGKLNRKTDVAYVLDKKPTFIELQLDGTFVLKPISAERHGSLPAFEDAQFFEFPENTDLSSIVGHGPFLTNTYASSERFRREYRLWFAYRPNSQEAHSGTYVLIFVRPEALPADLRTSASSEEQLQP